MSSPIDNEIRIERTYDAPAETVWDLWTTPKGIESWWSPDGFTVKVQKLDLKPGGALVYTMTAAGAEQIAFMESAGMPLTTESRKTFVEINRPVRLAYSSLVDFVPDHEPYEFSTVIDIEPTGGRTRVTMTVEPMHDDVWTQRLIGGRQNELENLAKVIARS